MTKAYLGIDLGTGSIKALVVARDGRILGRGSHEYPIHRPRPGFAEQDPDNWWHGASVVVRDALADSGDVEISAIGLSGQMHGTVLLGATDNLVSEAIIWADSRSSKQVHEVTDRVGRDRLIAIAGSLPATGFQAPSVLWLQQTRPDLWNQVRKILLPKDYLRWQMTGVFATEPSDASSTLLFDINAREWSDTILAAIGIHREQMPPVVESISIAGELTQEAALHLQLPAGIPVIAGGADAPLAALGAGVTTSESMLLTISTGSQVMIPSSVPRIDASGRSHGWCSCIPVGGSGAGWYQMGATLASGLALRWLRDNVFGLSSETAFDEMTTVAEDIEPGSSGLIFLPYLIGERTPLMDSNARGMFLGLTTEHNRGHLTRAVIEGSIFALFDAFEAIVRADDKPRHAILAGGGVRGTLWRQVVADVFGLPIFPLTNVEGSAMGATLLAGAGAGDFDLTESATSWATYDERVEPNEKAHDIYQQLLPIFRSAYVKHMEDFAYLGALASTS